MADLPCSDMPGERTRGERMTLPCYPIFKTSLYRRDGVASRGGTGCYLVRDRIPQCDYRHTRVVGVEGKNTERGCAEREMLRFGHH